jgi:hypothetical protein
MIVRILYVGENCMTKSCFVGNSGTEFARVYNCRISAFG